MPPIPRLRCARRRSLPDADGFIEGEDSYHSGPVSITKLTPEELPQEYCDLMGASSGT